METEEFMSFLKKAVLCFLRGVILIAGLVISYTRK